MYVSDYMRPFKHTVYLNNIFLALTEKRLYASGPGPESVYNEKGVRVHPETGEPVLYNAMISLPPQHGKSSLLSEHAPAHYLTTHPDEGIIFVTHTGDYGEKYGGANRNHIETHPQFGIRVSQVSGAKDYWEVEGHRGYMLSVGVGSNRVTGRGGNILIDDLIGSEEDAQNPRTREKVLDYWYARLRTRRRRESWCLYVGTRWHHGDFAGHMKATEKGLWFEVNLPALAFDTVDDEGYSIDPDTGLRDPLGRRPGEALCPELHNQRELEAVRQGNPAWFAPLYQGRPTLAEGSLFKNFSYYHQAEGVYVLAGEVYEEKDCTRFGVVDAAVTTKSSSDYTVFGVFDLHPTGKVFVRHIERVRIEGYELDEFITNQGKMWNCLLVGVEEAPYTVTLIQRLQRANEIVVHKCKPRGKDKWHRATWAANLTNNGTMILPAYSTWKEELELELRQFDKGEHDDQVDVMAYAAEMIKNLPTQKLTPAGVPKRSINEKLARIAEAQPIIRKRADYSEGMY